MAEIQKTKCIIGEKLENRLSGRKRGSRGETKREQENTCLLHLHLADLSLGDSRADH